MPKKKEKSNFLNDIKIKSYVGHNDDVTCCAFSTDWSLLVTGANDMTLKLWNMIHNKIVFTMTGHTKPLKCVCFSDDNTKIASGGHDALVMVWSVTDGKHLNVLKGHLLAVESVSFSLSGYLLCSCSWDNTAILWDLPSSAPIRILDNHRSVVQCCAFSWDCDMLATASWDYSIHVYNIKEKNTADLRMTILEFQEKCHKHSESGKVHQLPVKTNSMNRRPSTASALCSRKPIQTSKRPSTSHENHRKQKTELDMKVLDGHCSNIKALSFSQKNLLASASWDCTVIIWNPNTGEKLHHLIGHEGFVQACAFSYDGIYLASASDDNTVKIWSVEDGSLIKTLDSFTEEIHQLSFTKSGTLLATGPECISLQLY